jgi:biopolymer transport protein ExbD
MKVNLPNGMTMARLKGDNPLVVTVTAKNEIYISNTLVNERALNEKMTGFAKADRRASLVDRPKTNE